MMRRRFCAPVPATVRTKLVLAATSKLTSASTAASWDGFIAPHLYTVAEDCASLRLVFHAKEFPGDPATVAGFTIDECAVEDVLSGAFARVTFSGSNSLTMSAGAVNQASDVILASSLSLGIFAKGRSLRVRIRGTVTQGANFPVCYRGTNKATFYEKTTCTPSAVMSNGTMSVSGTNQTLSAGSYSPVLVGVRNSASSAPCLMITGDSLYDNHEPNFVGMAAATNDYALLEWSRGGMDQADLAGDTSWTAYLQYVSVYIDNMGTNASTDTTSFATYWGIAANTYGKPIYHTGLYPRASASSDSYATLAGQTAATGWNPPVVEPYFDARVADGTLAGQFRPATIRDAATNKWAVDGTANKYTNDGVHPSAFSETTLATEFTPVLATWMSGRLAPTT